MAAEKAPKCVRFHAPTPDGPAELDSESLAGSLLPRLVLVLRAEVRAAIAEEISRWAGWHPRPCDSEGHGASDASSPLAALLQEGDTRWMEFGTASSPPGGCLGDGTFTDAQRPTPGLNSPRERMPSKSSSCPALVRRKPNQICFNRLEGENLPPRQASRKSTADSIYTVPDMTEGGQMLQSRNLMSSPMGTPRSSLSMSYPYNYEAALTMGSERLSADRPCMIGAERSMEPGRRASKKATLADMELRLRNELFAAQELLPGTYNTFSAQMSEGSANKPLGDRKTPQSLLTTPGGNSPRAGSLSLSWGLARLRTLARRSTGAVDLEAAGKSPGGARTCAAPDIFGRDAPSGSTGSTCPVENEELTNVCIDGAGQSGPATPSSLRSGPLDPQVLHLRTSLSQIGGFIRQESPGKKRGFTCDDLRHGRERQLVAAIIADGVEVQSEHGNDEDEKGWQRCRRRFSKRFFRMLPKFCGIEPWDTQYRAASILYQWTVTAAALGSTLLLFCEERRVMYHDLDRDMERTADRAYFLSHVLDTLMASGAVVCLLSCGSLWYGKTIYEVSGLLESYLRKTGYADDSAVFSMRDLYLSAALLAAATLLKLFCAGDDFRLPLAFVVVGLIHIGITTYILHICHSLTQMVDAFCEGLLENPQIQPATHNWNLFQAVCRTTCSGIQDVFTVQQATATAVILLCIFEVQRGIGFEKVMALAPDVLLVLALLRTSVWAAGISDKCARVPMLVNSLNFGPSMDRDRMYIVEYIVHSRAGFYIFDVRLTSASVLKAAYVACAVTLGLATQML